MTSRTRFMRVSRLLAWVWHPAKGRNSGDEIALFVLLNQYGEFSFGLHTSTLLQEILA
jgi:hypothetical protein